MSLAPPPAFAPGTEIAGHLVLTTVADDRRHLRLRGRDGQGRGAEVAIAVVPGADDAVLRRARDHAQRLASVGHAAICVPDDICLIDHGLVTIRPWFDTLLSDGACVAGLSVQACLGVVTDLADALERAHRRGLTHGSVGTSNVAVDADGRARLLDARPNELSAADDTMALGRTAVDWLRDYEAGPTIEVAIDACVATAAGRVGAAEFRASLMGLLQAAEATDAIASVPATPSQTRRGSRPRTAAATFVVVAAATAVVWAGSMDRTATPPATASTALRPCDGTSEVGGTERAEIVLGDLYGEGCGVGVIWWPSRAEAEVSTGPAAGRFRLGEPGDHLVLGDWDGDGADDPALYRPSTGEIFSWSAWPSDGQVAPTSSQRDSGVVAGEPLVVDDGDRQAIEVLDSTKS